MVSTNSEAPVYQHW